ncbi:uncharacterized protein MONBRDRAFT_22307 [Monosiga brevicollis MX1]|uniref:Uncharacterized protein n=1 Tax=Monosiga brevicollis TaxID=81824 RepID=A9UQ68_MONBE|nr:uncharacterized protein MONBRDRAFT_22307 [Monosiga brevicollis MX1]EDQ92995.1 predicted protein [Monosiga brevicollis MX1]|eukprot:XP_001742757.1 hypothetical protein [Monosiga brevicollis MX1]
MGLLSDPENQRRVLRLLRSRKWPLVGCVVVVALAALLALPYDEVSQPDHIQENALSPHLVSATVSRTFEERAEQLVTSLQTVRTSNEQLEEIASFWQKHGLEHHWVDCAEPSPQRCAVLATEWLHKDVLVLVAAHHRPATESLARTLLEDTTHLGSLQAVLCVEGDAANFQLVKIMLGGDAGSMPNYDMVLAARAAMRQVGINSIIGTEVTEDYKRGTLSDPVKRYMASLKVFWRGLRDMALGVPESAHAPFLRRNVPALTLTLAAAPHQRPVRAERLGGIVEVVLRTLNNHCQRFNLSFNYYIPTGYQRIVSIGRYLGPALALLGAVLLWVLGTHAAPKEVANAPPATPAMSQKPSTASPDDKPEESTATSPRWRSGPEPYLTEIPSLSLAMAASLLAVVAVALRWQETRPDAVLVSLPVLGLPLALRAWQGSYVEVLAVLVVAFAVSFVYMPLGLGLGALLLAVVLTTMRERPLPGRRTASPAHSTVDR